MVPGYVRHFDISKPVADLSRSYPPKWSKSTRDDNGWARSTSTALYTGTQERRDIYSAFRIWMKVIDVAAENNALEISLNPPEKCVSYLLCVS